MARSKRTCYSCRVAGHESRDCPLPKACVMCGSLDHLRPQCPHQQGGVSRHITSRTPSQSIAGPVASRGIPPARRGAGARGGFVQRRALLPPGQDAYKQDQITRVSVQEKAYAMSVEETEAQEDVVTDHILMGQQTVSVDSDESGSNNENADVESEDVEEEEPSEEDPLEEEPDEEAQDEEAEEEPSEDPEEVSNEGSPVSQSYNRKDAKSIQSNSKKMRISSNIATEPERTFNTSGIHNSPNNVTVPVKLGTTARTGKRRQSNWDGKDVANEPATGGASVGTKKRKSRWSNDVPQTSLSSHGQKVNFAEMGSGFSPLNAPPPLSVFTMPSMNNATSHESRPKKVIDDANLYVGCLPQSVDDNALIELFAPFGSLSKVNVIRDRSTNVSKGYGFVVFADRISAAKAVAQMNGVKIDGKVLAVRIAGILPPSHINQLPSYSGTSVIAQNNSRPMCWPGPPESRLPETITSLSSICSYPVHYNPFSGQYLGFQTPTPNSLVSGNFATSTELGQFPGYLKSLDSPPLFHRPSMPSDSVPSSQDHFIHNFGCYQMPPT